MLFVVFYVFLFSEDKECNDNVASVMCDFLFERREKDIVTFGTDISPMFECHPIEVRHVVVRWHRSYVVGSVRNQAQ